MSNIASLLKSEIVRLARKEIRKELEALRKASAQHRSDIAALKRKAATLEKQATRLGKVASRGAHRKVEGEEGAHHRFSAKRLAARRKKLGLSAAELGVLLGVSALTIYNWEKGKSRPRQQHLEGIAALRKTGKRELKARLASMETA